MFNDSSVNSKQRTTVIQDLLQATSYKFDVHIPKYSRPAGRGALQGQD
jgi:hypothetical protein